MRLETIIELFELILFAIRVLRAKFVDWLHQLIYSNASPVEHPSGKTYYLILTNSSNVFCLAGASLVPSRPPPWAAPRSSRSLGRRIEIEIQIEIERERERDRDRYRYINRDRERERERER